MASCKCITSSASRYIDKILQPHMKRVRSYCKNATHIVRILEIVQVPPTSYLATLDIESLYTNISFDMAIEVFLKIFAGHPRLVLYLDLLKYVLKTTYFNLAAGYITRSVASPWVQRWRLPWPRLLLPTTRIRISRASIIDL